MLKTEELKELDPQSQVLFMWFCLLADDKGETALSHGQLSELCRMSRKTVISRIGILVDKGFIIKKNRFVQQTQQSNLYQITKTILKGDFQMTKDVIEEFYEYRKIFPNKSKGKKTGLVYLLKCGNYHKIGKTLNLETRLRQYISESPYEVDVIHKVKVEDYAGVEKYLHGLVANSRIKGEWFELSEQQIATVIEEMNICKV